MTDATHRKQVVISELDQGNIVVSVRDHTNYTSQFVPGKYADIVRRAIEAGREEVRTEHRREMAEIAKAASIILPSKWWQHERAHKLAADIVDMVEYMMENLRDYMERLDEEAEGYRQANRPDWAERLQITIDSVWQFDEGHAWPDYFSQFDY